eukprot:COSAG02_NODE_1743_length_11100_cov_17.677575_9_plen_56_part_00
MFRARELALRCSDAPMGLPRSLAGATTDNGFGTSVVLYTATSNSDGHGVVVASNC